MTSPYDPALFEGAARYYARYRPKYPKAAFEFIARRFSLDRNARVLDLGCGTGNASLPLAPIVGEIVAMDPDAAMIESRARDCRRGQYPQCPMAQRGLERPFAQAWNVSPRLHGSVVPLDGPRPGLERSPCDGRRRRRHCAARPRARAGVDRLGSSGTEGILARRGRCGDEENMSANAPATQEAILPSRDTSRR